MWNLRMADCKMDCYCDGCIPKFGGPGKSTCVNLKRHILVCYASHDCFNLQSKILSTGIVDLATVNDEIAFLLPYIR